MSGPKLEQWGVHGPVQMIPKRPLLDTRTGKLVRGWRLRGSFGFVVTCECGEVLLQSENACLSEWDAMVGRRSHTHLTCTKCGTQCEVELGADGLTVEGRDPNGCPGEGRPCGRPLQGGTLCKWCEKRARRKGRVRSQP